MEESLESRSTGNCLFCLIVLFLFSRLRPLAISLCAFRRSGLIRVVLFCLLHVYALSFVHVLTFFFLLECVHVIFVFLKKKIVDKMYTDIYTMIGCILLETRSLIGCMLLLPCCKRFFFQIHFLDIL